MKKKIISITLLLSLLCIPIFGCASWWHKSTEMPTIELPKAPEKPNIKSKVIKLDNEVYVGYTLSDSFKLFEFLHKKDAYEDMLIYRIDQMNILIKKLGKAK